MKSAQLDRESMQACAAFTKANWRNQAEYWQQRTEDTMELVFDAMALMANLCCEVRTELDLLRAERSKLRVELEAQ